MRAITSTMFTLAIVLALGCETSDRTARNGDRTGIDDTTPIIAGPRVVDMEGFNFRPSRITIAVGDTVEWRNTTRTEHTVTCDPSFAQNPNNVKLPERAETFNSGLIRPGESFFHTFSVPGTYRYICIPHEQYGMIGEVQVVEPFVTVP